MLRRCFARDTPDLVVRGAAGFAAPGATGRRDIAATGRIRAAVGRLHDGPTTTDTRTATANTHIKELIPALGCLGLLEINSSP